MSADVLAVVWLIAKYVLIHIQQFRNNNNNYDYGNNRQVWEKWRPYSFETDQAQLKTKTLKNSPLITMVT